LAPVHHAETRRDFQTAQIPSPGTDQALRREIVFKLLCLDTQRQIARLTVAEELARFRERGFDLTVKKQRDRDRMPPQNQEDRQDGILDLLQS
jgi:hypothetical protein